MSQIKRHLKTTRKRRKIEKMPSPQQTSWKTVKYPMTATGTRAALEHSTRTTKNEDKILKRHQTAHLRKTNFKLFRKN